VIYLTVTLWTLAAIGMGLCVGLALGKRSRAADAAAERDHRGRWDKQWARWESEVDSPPEWDWPRR
jgi:hypothetical protein